MSEFFRASTSWLEISAANFYWLQNWIKISKAVLNDILTEATKILKGGPNDNLSVYFDLKLQI
jgi:hypothetical protein